MDRHKGLSKNPGVFLPRILGEPPGRPKQTIMSAETTEGRAGAGSREKILRRIREALQMEAPRRHLGEHESHGEAAADPGEPIEREKWLPEVPDSLEGKVELFEKNSADLKTEVVRCEDWSKAAAALAEVAKAEGWSRIAIDGSSKVAEATSFLRDLEVIRVEEGFEIADLESADAGISSCECLVAQTGSILVSAVSNGGRSLSVLPGHHVVIATESQMVRDLEAAFQTLRAAHPGSLPRYFSFITGPSRTGDIERILVLGAHGPKKLTVFLVKDDS